MSGSVIDRAQTVRSPTFRTAPEMGTTQGFLPTHKNSQGYLRRFVTRGLMEAAQPWNEEQRDEFSGRHVRPGTRRGLETALRRDRRRLRRRRLLEGGQGR